MQLKKIVTWALVIFVGFWVVTQPHGAQEAMQGLVGLLKHAGNNLAGFLKSL